MKSQDKRRSENKRREIAAKLRVVAEDVRAKQGRSLLRAVARDYERKTGPATRKSS